MKKQTIIRAAILSALAIAAIVLGVIAFTAQDSPAIPVDVLPAATPTPIIFEMADPTPSPEPVPVPTTTQEESTPAISPTLKQNSGVLFTLSIKDKKVSVAYGVEESTLKKTPGWLTTSALPGQDGMCVVYGHRNRAHLRVLEKAKIGDIITVTMQDGTAYAYTVSDIKINERTENFRLPSVEGRTLVLATCYPFRYSGHAPGKCVVIAEQR